MKVDARADTAATGRRDGASAAAVETNAMAAGGKRRGKHRWEVKGLAERAAGGGKQQVGREFGLGARVACCWMWGVTNGRISFFFGGERGRGGCG